MTKKQKKTLYRIIIASVLILIIRLCHVENSVVEFLMFMVPYLIIGYDILRKAVKGILKKQVFDENFLMAAATVGAICLGEYVEGVAVMLFYQIGELFQGVAIGKSRKSISELMDIRPDYANVPDEDGNIVKADPDEVKPGTEILVFPGEKIPIDGIITEGETALDTSALTGESVPRKAKAGDEVISGCISLSGLIRLRTTREFSESTVSRILELVENASSRKSRSENFISKFARFYTPAVCYGALALMLLPPAVLLLLGRQPVWGQWVMRGLTFLVISCPCALVISIPLTFFAGIGGAGNAGVLVKGSNYLEALSKTEYVVFDKTGTLTEGVFRVNETFMAEDSPVTEEEMLKLSAHAENYSTHPAAKSIRDAYGRKTDMSLIGDVEEISGHGVIAMVDGTETAVGNEKLMARLSVPVPELKAVGTVVHVAVNRKYAGCFVISDRIKANAAKAVSELKRMGIKKTVMLTGDTEASALAVAEELKVDEVYSRLLPEDKVERVDEILRNITGKGKLLFAGDGINDAPVLMRADIGIAMGALGSDAAIEAADVVLMDDDPLKIVKAIKISRKCLRIVYENIYFAIGIKAVCLILGALGLAGMWAAIFADVGVMVLAVLNAIRALNVRKC